MANQNLSAKPATIDPTGGELYIMKGGVDYRISNIDLSNNSASVTVLNAATHTIVDANYLMHITYTTTGPVVITIPSAQAVLERQITFKDAGGNASTNSITIITESSELIDGQVTYVINSNYEAITLYSDGTNWFII